MPKASISSSGLPECGMFLTAISRDFEGAAGGTGRRPALVEFEPSSFLRLYQTAHSELTVDKRDNLTDLTRRSATNSLALLPRSTVMRKQPAINRALRGGKKRTPSGIDA